VPQWPLEGVTLGWLMMAPQEGLLELRSRA
jgi:hypothetical protein